MGASFLNLVTTKVTVKGEEQKFVSLRLHQRFNRHHAFTVIVNYLSPGNTFKQTPEKFINYIGETVNISFAHKQTGESYDFEGVVTQVEMVGSMGEAEWPFTEQAPRYCMRTTERLTRGWTRPSPPS